MTLSGVYAPTVNESETITDAQRIRSTSSLPEARSVRSACVLVFRAGFVEWTENSPHLCWEFVKKNL
jgi:hypothetical protein